MTKKDFQAIANAISERLDTQHPTTEAASMIRGIARDLANVCQRNNPRFDRARFLKACGVEA